jgi:hypothetical protein
MSDIQAGHGRASIRAVKTITVPSGRSYANPSDRSRLGRRVQPKDSGEPTITPAPLQRGQLTPSAIGLRHIARRYC